MVFEPHRLAKAVFGTAVVIVSIAGQVSADFHVNAVKTDQGDRDIVDLYFFNDGLNGTGTALEAYELTYNGTPTPFRMLNPRAVDVLNTVDDPNFSWVRVHPEIEQPFRLDPVATDVRWQSPISTFKVTYATFAAIPLPANVGLGAQFARFVLPDGGSFSVNGLVGGESGLANVVAFSQDYYVPNVPPEITGDGIVLTGGTDSGAGAHRSNLLTRRITAADIDGLLRSFTIDDLDDAASKGFIFEQVDLGTYDVSWDPSRVANGTYGFRFTAVDSSIQANSTTTALLQVVVAPEPSLLAATSCAGMTFARRRRRCLTSQA